ncbi:MAG: hypothetical protein KAI94_12945, partial [Anaerolineales bacterium]|nr:hypothetical protein [Anaerolineales bacterium]
FTCHNLKRVRRGTCLPDGMWVSLLDYRQQVTAWRTSFQKKLGGGFFVGGIPPTQRYDPKILGSSWPFVSFCF